MSGSECAACARFLFANQTYLIFFYRSRCRRLSALHEFIIFLGERYAYQRELRFYPWIGSIHYHELNASRLSGSKLTCLATIVVCLHVTSGNIQQPSLPSAFFINSMHVSHTFTYSLTFNCTLKSHNKIICSERHWKTILVEVSSRNDGDNCPPGYRLWRWQSQQMGNDIPTWRIDQCQLGRLLPFGSECNRQSRCG